ncbi:MAG: hypothetical protein N2F24_04840, partial [Deltaproteobacteria bacterium]
FMAAAREESLQEWMDEWVFGCRDRQAYLDHYVEKFSSGRLQKLVAKPLYSAPANYGSAFLSTWDENGKDRGTGLTLVEIENLLEERGLLHD